MSKPITVGTVKVLIFVICVLAFAAQCEEICSNGICPNDNCSNEAQNDVSVNDKTAHCSSLLTSRSKIEKNLGKTSTDKKCPLILPKSTKSADGRCVHLTVCTVKNNSGCNAVGACIFKNKFVRFVELRK